MFTPDPYADFRLNLEQQKKRAKELLGAAKNGNASALQRIIAHNAAITRGNLTLAAAQHALARELRFVTWAALKQHINAMHRHRNALNIDGSALDGDLRTLHIRCGHDIQHELVRAGLRGDFTVHINPYVQGPVTAEPDWLAQRARFICDALGADFGMGYADVLAGCHDEEQRLAGAITGYQRVVLWFELDAHDQLILSRCLAFFAEHGSPPRLELVSVGDFPGAQRFIGLGQLPPEALRLLWQQRRTLDNSHLQLGRTAWQAYLSDDPRPLARLLKQDTSLLPQLAPALRRQLQELPSPLNGLGATQQVLLATLERFGKLKVARLIGETFLARDPYSGIGDTGLDYELQQMEKADEAIFIREHRGGMRKDIIEITEPGRALLAGKVNWLTMQPPPRWIGGVCIRPGQANWHWDDSANDVKLLAAPQRADR